MDEIMGPAWMGVRRGNGLKSIRLAFVPEPSAIIRAQDIELNRLRMQVTVEGRRIDVTPTEFELLATLARQPGRVFTRAQLLDAIRGLEAESFDRAVDVHVKNLRRKLEPDPRNPRYVLTVYGIGFSLPNDRPSTMRVEKRGVLA